MRRPHLFAAALVVVALPVSATANDLVRKGGVLGDAVTYEVAATPFTSVALIPSLSTGPTPLFIFDPGDPRLLDVGLDLVSFVTVMFTDPAGNASVSFPLPSNPGFQGVPLYAQALEVTVFPTLFGQMSNATGFTLGSKHGSFNAIGPSYAPIFGQTQELLPDGRVLIVGGYDDTDPSGVKKTLGVYDPQTEKITQEPGLMQDDRVLNTVTVLQDGTVLIVGGADVTATPRKSCDIYDPATGQTTPTGNLLLERAGHTATLLADGRVFVAGGVFKISSTDPLSNLDNVTDTTEIWDPTTGAWTSGPPLPKPRFAHTATLIPNFDWVLLAGGAEISSTFGIKFIAVTTDCQRYIPDPSGATVGGYFPTAPMNEGRALAGDLLLDNGTILQVAGGDITIVLSPAAVDMIPRTSTEVYDPILDTWTFTAPLNHGRTFPSVVRADNGDIVVLGGNVAGDFIELLLAEDFFGVEEIEESTQALALFQVTGMQTAKRYFGGFGTAVDGGQRVLIIGEGDNGSGTHDLSVELYNP